MLVLIIASLVFAVNMDSVPAYEITQKVAVERATIHTVNEYGAEAVKKTMYAGHVVPGSPLALAIDNELTRLYKLSNRGGESRGLPTLKPDHVLKVENVSRWVMSAL